MVVGLSIAKCYSLSHKRISFFEIILQKLILVNYIPNWLFEYKGESLRWIKVIKHWAGTCLDQFPMSL